MNIRKVLFIVAIVVFIALGFICLIIYRSIPKSSLKIKANKIHSISINGSFIPFEGEGLTSGFAEIIGHDGINDVVQTLNSMKLSPGYIEELGGDSPLVWVIFHNMWGGELFRIDFYDSLISFSGSWTGGYYQIDMSEYEKLRELCRKYGEVQ